MNIIIIPYLPSTARAYPMAKYFVKAGNNVHMVLWDMPYPITLDNIWRNIKNSWRYHKYIKEEVMIHKIRRLPFFFPPINKLLFKKQVRMIFKEFDVDLIISETYFNETEPPLDLPILYDMSDDHEAFSEIYGSSIYKLAYKVLQVRKTIINQIKNCRAVIAVSESLVEYAEKFRDVKIYKVTNGVEGWVINESYLEGEKHSLVYVTNFGKWSEVYRLIYTIKKLKIEYPDIKLVLIGDGPEIHGAKEKVKKLKLNENIIFFGSLDDRKKLFKEINKYEVCLNISEKNKFRDSASPLKIFEYSALGKKIVSTNLNEVKKLNFPNIYFYEKDKHCENLLNAIKIAFDAKVNVKKTKDLVQEYSWENIIKRLLIIMKTG